MVFRRVLPSALPLALALLFPLAALAHGGEHIMQLDHVVVGDYRLTLWTGPEVLRPGQILLEALVSDPAADQAVKGMNLRYEVQFDNGHHQGQVMALAAAPLETLSERNLREELHLAVADLREVGPYQVRVIVTDPQGMEHRSELTIQIVPDNPWMAPVLYALSGITALVSLAFLWHTIRRLRFWWPGRPVVHRA